MSKVLAVSRNPEHTFSKLVEPCVRLIAGFGVEGDAHAGATVQHLYRKKKDADAPNLCQVHLLQSELFAELRAKGFELSPGEMGENIATFGVDLLSLPVDTLIHLGHEATVQVTGLRDPCHQMDRLRPGLMKACIERTPDGAIARKSGIMGTVHTGGVVSPGDEIAITLPPAPHRRMGPV